MQNVIFKHLQQGARVQVWLYDNIEQRLEGKILVRPLSLLSLLVGWVLRRVWAGLGGREEQVERRCEGSSCVQHWETALVRARGHRSGHGLRLEGRVLLKEREVVLVTHEP